MDSLFLPLVTGAVLALSLIGMGALVLFAGESSTPESESQSSTVELRSADTVVEKTPRKKAA